MSISTPFFSNNNLIFEFYAKSKAFSWLENYEVYVSTQGNTPGDFNILLEEVIDAPDDWELKSYNLSNHGISFGDEIFLAIRCISIDEFRLLIDDVNIYEDASTSVNAKPAKPHLFVYPNPTNDKINIQINLPDETITGVSLIDISGKEIYRKNKLNITELSEEINLGGFSSGVYSLLIKTSNKVYSKRIIKN